MRGPDWLTARPVAHRGLHDEGRGIIENMPAAAEAAIAGNFAIECDIQLTADGEAMCITTTRSAASPTGAARC